MSSCGMEEEGEILQGRSFVSLLMEPPQTETQTPIIMIPTTTTTTSNRNKRFFDGSNKAAKEEEEETIIHLDKEEEEEENDDAFGFKNPSDNGTSYPQLFRAVLTPREFPPPPVQILPIPTDHKQSPLHGEAFANPSSQMNEEYHFIKKKMVPDQEIENQTPTKRKNKYVWPKIDDKSKPKPDLRPPNSKKNPKVSTTSPSQTCPISNPETSHMCPVTPSVVQEPSRKKFDKTCRRALHFDSEDQGLEDQVNETGKKGKKGKKGSNIVFEDILVPKKKRSKLAMIDSLIKKFLSLSCNEITSARRDGENENAIAIRKENVQECQCPNCCRSRTGVIMKSLSKKQQKVVETSLVPYHEKEKLAMTLFKKKLVPKADIDEETIRIWDLLIMGEEVPEDERTKAWWEKEKKVLYENIEMFIARMRVIQGDRRFSRWKGSVVDSVIGVFLTQNVSDALSSSAFMALAAKFPVKSQYCTNNEREEDVCMNNEREENVKEKSTNNHQNEKVKNENVKKQDESAKKWEEMKQNAKKWEEELRKKSSPPRDPNTLDSVDWEAIKSENSKKAKKWEEVRKKYSTGRPRDPNTLDSADWEAVRQASVEDVAEPIRERGQSNVLALRIKLFLDRIVEFHGSIDLEWLRDVPPNEVKEYLMDIRGIGLKSVECIRLLCLEHHAFPVDTNVGRIAVRLGWVPLQPLPENVQIHELKKFPLLNGIQKFLWARLHDLSQRKLYELHYHMITFGKVFCTKVNPNCNVCPLKEKCKHFASAFASAKLRLPGPHENAHENARTQETNAGAGVAQETGVFLLENNNVESRNGTPTSEPIIELPESPKATPHKYLERDIEDLCLYDDDDYDHNDEEDEDEDEIPTIVLNPETFRQNVLAALEKNKLMCHNSEMANSLVAINPEAASIPAQRLMSLSKLRSVHQVYELDDESPILEGFKRREPEDPCRYLFRMWTKDDADYPIQEYNDQIVLGSILVPSRTANRGSFPLNGTYFQPNEVFADYESSHNPIAVPRELLWNKPRRTLYCGTSVSSIHRGFTQLTEVQRCCYTGYYCIRGFERGTREPRPLPKRFHRPREITNKKSTTKNMENNIGEEAKM